MKFLGSTLLATAIFASSVIGAASEQNGAIQAPAIRRNTHHGVVKKRTCSSSSGKKQHKSKKNSSKSSSSGSSSSASNSSTNNDSSGSSSKSDSSSKSSSSASVSDANNRASGSGKNIKLTTKQGLAWPNANGMDINNFFIGKVDWYYSWGATPGWDNAPTDHLFCPMLWGSSGSGANVDKWKKNVLNDQDGKYNKYKCMMGPNEVNQKGQSDMSVSSACSLMRENMSPLVKKGWYFIGPSTTSAPDGLTWYKKFMSECKDVFDEFDAVSLHYYDTSIPKFKNYVENWHKVTGKDIWITEFACTNFGGGAQCTKSDAENMLTTMSKWFDEQDYVKGYAPFGTLQNLQGVSEVNRLSQGSNPTSLFRTFANA